jgi:hypothetical protein
MRISSSYSCLQKRVRDVDDEDKEPLSRKSSSRRVSGSAPQLSCLVNISSDNSIDTTTCTRTLETNTSTQPLLDSVAISFKESQQTHIDTNGTSIMSLHPSASASTLQQAFASTNVNCNYSDSSGSEDEEEYHDNDNDSIINEDTDSSDITCTERNSEHDCCISTSTATSSPKVTQKETRSMHSSISELDMHSLHTKNNLKGLSPDTFVQKLFHAMLGHAPITRRTLELAPIILQSSSSNGTISSSGTPFIQPITENDLANYDVDVVSATREEDLQTLSDLYHKQGRSLSCCNRYGESLLHMACRRGFFPIVSFLTQEAGVAIRITDDCGRTPLHDALWNRDCQYATVDLLIRKDPSLLLMCDKHGHSPFAYARREHWEVWKQFLWDRREHIMQALDHDVMELFRFKI